MAFKAIWTCDVCKEDHTDINPAMPTGWRHMAITVDLGMDKSQSTDQGTKTDTLIDVQLQACSGCCSRLRKNGKLLDDVLTAIEGIPLGKQYA